MTEKTFNKWFSGILMGLMVVTIGITTVFKLQEPPSSLACWTLPAAL